MQIINCEQNSPEWFDHRKGLPTASQFKIILHGGKSGGSSLTRNKYLYTLAGEIMTGKPAESYTNRHMQRGHELEPEARSYYALITDNIPEQVGFIRSKIAGCSPDSLIGETGLLEIKTALPAILIDTILKDRFPPEHKAQVQGQLWVTEREWADLIVYSRSIPPFIVRAYRDELYIRMLAIEIEKFNAELHNTIAKVKAYGGYDGMETKQVEIEPTPFDGLRPAVRMRLQRAIDLLKETGRLQRLDIQRIGEVSVPTASKDIAEINKRFPGLMKYDRSAKAYLLQGAQNG